MPTRGSAPGSAKRPPEPESPFRYSAVVYGTGEIPEIVECIGRRRMRVLNPRSKEGRELLLRGRVKLWLGPLNRSERLPGQ